MMYISISTAYNSTVDDHIRPICTFVHYYKNNSTYVFVFFVDIFTDIDPNCFS